jgi:site-specific recombinase XerD
VLELLSNQIRTVGTGRDGVIIHTNGEYMIDGRFYYLWKLARQQAGLDDRVHFHTLRHCFASSLISAGCSVRSVADALGHANPLLTLQAYAALWRGDDDRVRQAIDSTWNSADGLRTALPALSQVAIPPGWRPLGETAD